MRITKTQKNNTTKREFKTYLENKIDGNKKDKKDKKEEESKPEESKPEENKQKGGYKNYKFKYEDYRDYYRNRRRKI